MSFTLARRKIKCPNCQYSGMAEIEGSGCIWIMLWIAISLLSLYFCPLAIVSLLMMIWLIFKPAAQICPKCKWRHPVPTGYFEFD